MFWWWEGRSCYLLHFIQSMYNDISTTNSYQHKHKYRHDVMGVIRHVKKLVSLAKAYALDPDPTRNPDFERQLDQVASRHISASLRATLASCMGSRSKT